MNIIITVVNCYKSQIFNIEVITVRKFKYKLMFVYRACLILHTFFNYRVQNAMLSCMELGVNIAHNIALRENVFMMAVCVELKIPLFVIGKPGSSKSLAKSILAESMKGQNSKHPFLREFKAVSLF